MRRNGLVSRALSGLAVLLTLLSGGAHAQGSTYTCDARFYQLRQPATAGSNLYLLDRRNLGSGGAAQWSTLSSVALNALGYNKADGYFYAVNVNPLGSGAAYRLYRLGTTGAVEVASLTTMPNASTVAAGTVDGNGRMYIKLLQSDNRIYTVQLPASAGGSVGAQGSLTLTASVPLADLAFDPVTNKLYGVYTANIPASDGAVASGVVHQIDPATGTVTTNGSGPTVSTTNAIGTAFFDIGGTLYAYQNGGAFGTINLATGAFTRLAAASTASQSDGASCVFPDEKITASKVAGAVESVSPTVFRVPYAVTVANTGTIADRNVQVTENLTQTFSAGNPSLSITAAPAVTSGSATANPAFNGTSDTRLLNGTNTLAAGASVTVTFTVQVTYPNQASVPASGSPVNNVVYASSTSTGPNAGHTFPGGTPLPPVDVLAVSQSAPTPVTMVGQADLAITKTDYTATVLPGQTVTYTLRVVNSGPAGVTGATLTDNVPSSLSGVTWTCTASTGSSCASASGSGNVSVGLNLSSGGAATLMVKGSLSAGAAGILVNTASVAAPAGVTDPNPANNSATDTDTVTPSFCAARGGTLGTNLFAPNGNFGTTTGGAGTIGAALPAGRTTYTYVGTYPPSDGQYTISNQPTVSGFNAWHLPPDHTSGTTSGNMMVVNADANNVGVFYQETFTVTTNTNYELSAWIINLINAALNNTPALPNLSLEVDRAGFDDDNNPATADGAEGQTVFTSSNIPNTAEATWRYYGLIINSGAATRMTLRFRNNNLGGSGNDLALDDLSFTPCTGLPVGAVSGTLYRDRNSSGTFDAGGPDSRLGANIAVSLTDAGGGVTATAYTDASGNYSFVNVPAGSYKLWVATADPDLGGLTPRAPTSAEYTGVTLASGASLTGQHFGFNAPGLVLTKKVRNCGTVPSGTACPTAAPFGTAGIGKPGEVLEYCIDYSNSGGASAANVVLTDLVPGNTTADLSAYASGRGLQRTVGATVDRLTSAADADSGELTASQLSLRVGTLAAGASGGVCFRSTIR